MADSVFDKDKIKPGKGQKPCPYDDMDYGDIPGYVDGNGCPVCKAYGLHHWPVPIETDVKNIVE